MTTINDKRERAALFRDRLAEAMARAGKSRAALARETGVNRSTVAQFLADVGPRLPNAHLAAGCAAALGVSADWLLGLANRPERAGDLVEAAVSLSDAARAEVDDRILAWHREARGYKIRHVPATLPDVLKTEAVLRWEYARHEARTPAQAQGAAEDRRAWLREQLSDYEIAMPVGELRAFAAAAGYYHGMPPEARAPQLRALAARARDGYPALRIHLFDARRVFSAPVTVFGPLLATVYVGKVHLAFRSADRVRTLTRHFDGLVREAEVDARDAADWIDALADEIGD